MDRESMKNVKKFERAEHIQVDTNTEDTDTFLELFRVRKETNHRRMQIRLDPYPLDMKQPDDHTRFVCISDTHNSHREMKHPIPPGDVLLHCGDFTDGGKLEEVEDFNEWLATLPHKHKICIAGNHELSFDEKLLNRVRENCKTNPYARWKFLNDIPEEKTNDWSKVLTNCLLINDAEVSVNGIRIYGCSWNPYFGGWAFNEMRGQPLLDKWNKIPGDGIDILMTHSPPAGQCDCAVRYDRWDRSRIEERVGDVELLNTVQLRVKPKFHVFGHIHEAYGIRTDGWHKYINCSIVNQMYDPVNAPVIFDLPNKAGAPEGMGEVIQH